MRKVTDGCRTYFSSAVTTAREVGQYASEEMIHWVIAKLAASDYAKLGKVCYVFGAGSQPS